MSMQLTPCFFENTNSINSLDLSPGLKEYGINLPYTVTVGDLIILGTTILAAQYNFENLIIGFKAAKDK